VKKSSANSRRIPSAKFAGHFASRPGCSKIINLARKLLISYDGMSLVRPIVILLVFFSAKAFGDDTPIIIESHDCGPPLTRFARASQIADQARFFRDQLRAEALRLQAQALSEKNLAEWLLAKTWDIYCYDSRNFEWIFELLKATETYTVNHWIAEYGRPENLRLKEIRAQNILEMKKAIQVQSEKPDQIRFSIRLIDERDANRNTYGVLLVFPKSASLAYFKRFRGLRELSENSHYLYFEVSQTCTHYACHQLTNGANSLQTGEFSFEEVLETPPPGFGHIELWDFETGTLAHAPRRYLLQAILGYFSNERLQYVIPDALLEPGP
jgi:hypothetical protein